MPAETVVEALPLMHWRRTVERTAASETAALMVYVALIHMSDQETREVPYPANPLMPLGLTFTTMVQMADATYDDLQQATGLSRPLVSAGVSRLEELDLIHPEGSHQKRRYCITSKGTTGGWFKLPRAAIVRNHTIFPFGHFLLRSKHELHAMKLYLYLAAVRPNGKEFALSTYETIHKRTGIPERDIRKALSLLIGTGLLRNIHREHEANLKNYGPNQYYLTGSDKLKGYDSEQVPAATA